MKKHFGVFVSVHGVDCVDIVALVAHRNKLVNCHYDCD